MLKKTLKSLITTVGLVLLASVAAQAQTIFQVSAIASNGSAITGTLTIDLATGIVTAVNLTSTAPTASICTSLAAQTPVGNNVILDFNCVPPFSLRLSLVALGGTLVGYNGGQINAPFPFSYFAGGNIVSGATAFGLPGTYQVRYASNLSFGDSVINFTNAGGSSTSPGTAAAPFAQNGEICANLYAYSPDEQMVSCCSCNVTPNALNSLSVKNDLVSNTLTPIIPTAVVVKVIATPGGAACTASSAATIPLSGATLSIGLLAWGTTIHPLPVTAGTPPTTFGLTGTAFSNAQLSVAELTRMTQLCGFIRANGSGYGICKSCKVGGLGATSR